MTDVSYLYFPSSPRRALRRAWRALTRGAESPTERETVRGELLRAISAPGLTDADVVRARRELLAARTGAELVSWAERYRALS